MTAAEHARIFREEAERAGFHRIGFAPVERWERHAVYRRWLEAGHAADMDYLASQAEERADPRRLLAEARSIVTVGLSYAHPEGAAAPALRPVETRLAAPAAPTEPRGFVARYARGTDYHMVLKQRLRRVAQGAAARLGRPIASLACVDTAPLLEREAAHRGGVGFLAKNTMIIAPGMGSYLLLGELLTDVEIASGDAQEPRCGRCRACLDACPTGAFVDAYTLDARRCISYLTIENQGPIPRALRPAVENMIFGCDRCQEVCPFNAPLEGARATGDAELAPRPGRAHPPLARLLGLGAAQFRKYVARTALRRIHRAQLLRNVAVALGNTGGPDEVPALARALDEPSALVRVHVAWALGRIAARHPDCPARATLEAHRTREPDASVLEEITASLDEIAELAGAHRR